MNASILQAFQSARYIVQAPDGEIQLRVGRRSTAMNRLMHDHHASCAAILTAWNPGGKPSGKQANVAAQAALEAQLCATGAAILAGRNMAAEDDPSTNDWTEPTAVVFGISLTQAEAVARAYGQLAFVYVRAGGMPELIWARPSHAGIDGHARS